MFIRLFSISDSFHPLNQNKYKLTTRQIPAWLNLFFLLPYKKLMNTGRPVYSIAGGGNNDFCVCPDIFNIHYGVFDQDSDSPDQP
jgi:hypothetical protein